MNQMTPPPKIEIIPSSAPFSDAQRSWLNGFFAGLLIGWRSDAAVGGAGRCRAAGPGRRWRRRRSAVARPDHADLGSHEARRRPAAAPAHDGGDGAAGLRPVRLQLPRLFRRDREQGGAASQSLRSRRQGNRPDAEGAERGAGKGAGGVIRPGGRTPAAAAPAVTAEPGRSRDNPVAATFLSRRLLNKTGSEKETWHIDFDLSRRRPRLCRRRFLRHLCPQRSRPCRPDHCLAGRVAYDQGARQDAARSADRRGLAGAGAGQPVRTALLSSPAARSARRRARWRRARIPTAMPRRST